MKKLIQICAALALAACVSHAADRFEGTVVVPAGATTGSATVELFRAGGAPCGTIDTVFATVTSGSGTGVVTFATYEYGKTSTIVASSSISPLSDAFWDRPVTSESILYTYPVVQNVATGANSQVVLAVRNLQTNYAVEVKAFLARQLRVSVVQAEAMATDTTYQWVVLTKEDPPSKK